MKLTPISILDVPVGRFFQVEGQVYLRIRDGRAPEVYGPGSPIFRAVNRFGHEIHKFTFDIRGNEMDPVRLISFDQDPFGPL